MVLTLVGLTGCSTEPPASGAGAEGGPCHPSLGCDAGLVCNDRQICVREEGPCRGVVCSGHGSCSAAGGQAQCRCDSGYHAAALSCVADAVEACKDVTCSGHGTCAAAGGGARCDCTEGYHVDGLDCVEDLAPCDGVTCLGHGTCSVVPDEPRCDCDSGYHAQGLYCVKDGSPCDGVTCSGHGACTAVTDQASCECDSGFRAAGPVCVDSAAPTAPSALAAAAVSATQVNLTWTASTDNVGVSGYEVQRCSGPSCTSFAPIATSTTASYSNLGLAASTTYRFRVRASDAAQNHSAFSAPASVTTPAGRALPAGILNVVSVPGVYPDDPSKDSSSGIQAAMNQAKAANQTLYFPPGTTYYVSKTLLGVQPYSGDGCTDPSGSSFRLMGGGKNAARPTIVLKDASPGFNAAAPKNLIFIGKDGDNDGVPDSAGASCAFGHVFKNINLVLGNNPKAVGISMNVAQRGALEDVKIVATGAYAGISGVPGRSTSVGNLEIIGGQYGIRFIDFPVGISLYGLRLKGQSARAIIGAAARSFVVVGFEIEKATGPAIETEGTDEQRGHVGLYDGIIKLGAPGTGILNAARRIVDLRRIYLHRASTALDNGSDGAVAGSGASWITINEHTHCPASIGGGKVCWNLVGGVKSRNSYSSITTPSAAPPPTLVSQHIWDGSPPILDPGVVYITDPPFNASPNDGTDDRAAIQAAIDSTEPGGANAGKAVFVPPGTYDLSGHITLKAATHIFGIPYGQSELHALDSWTNTLQASSPHKWVIETVDDANATTSIEYIWPTWKVSYSKAGIWMGTALWRAGRNSVMRGVRGERASGRCEDRPRQLWRVEGHGGGRWYTWMEELAAAKACQAAADLAPDFRKLYITGTTEPLTVYGPNPEHGGLSSTGYANPFIEIVKAANVRFFGIKSETNGTMIVIRDASQNIFFAGVNSFHFEESGLPYVRVESSQNIALSLVAAWGSDASALLTESGMGAGDVVNHDAEIGIYRRGTINWSAWPASLPAP